MTGAKRDIAKAENIKIKTDNIADRDWILSILAQQNKGALEEM